MDTDTYSGADVVAAQARDFVPVRLNHWAVRDLGRRLGVNGTPVTVFLDGDEPVMRVRSYRGTADWLVELRRALDARATMRSIRERLTKSPDDPAILLEEVERLWEFDLVAAARDRAEKLFAKGVAGAGVVLLDILAHDDSEAVPNGNALLQLAMKVGELDPKGEYGTADDVAAFEALAWHVLRDPAQARDAAKRALEKHAGSPRADMMHYVLGMSEHASGRADDAVKSLREAARSAGRYGAKAREALEALRR